MTLNHIHVSVRDLPGALEWLAKVWELNADFQNERMATVVFGAFILILDAGESDTAATIGFESDNCDRDFESVVARGAKVLEAPADKPWGVRAAYIQGPGQLKFEIEGPGKRVTSDM